MNTVHDAIEAAVSRSGYRSLGERTRKLNRINKILREIEAHHINGVYAQTMNHFWYKVYFFTSTGTLKFDTIGVYLVTADEAMRIVRAQNLQRVTRDEVLSNWAAVADNLYDVRSIERDLIEKWRDGKLGNESSVDGRRRQTTTKLSDHESVATT